MAGIPSNPKIYHIVHEDRLASILGARGLLCDQTVVSRNLLGTMIGLADIKQRRLSNPINSHPGLTVGQCVPFYFCRRSVMLYLIYKKNPELSYQGGQEPIIHLEADLGATVRWAKNKKRRWAFTLSNAGSNYFQDRDDLNDLGDLKWTAISAQKWSGQGVPSSVMHGKQAEFLIEECFPWHLVERIGVFSQQYCNSVGAIIANAPHKPILKTMRNWYY